MIRTGLDIGSTTIKCIALDESGKICFKSYQRHFSRISENALLVFEKLASLFPGENFSFSISGSAGMGIAGLLGIPFIQEVAAAGKALEKNIPEADVAVELGGEDAKILFLSGNRELRMNGSCAGGTGAFIDQMASLLDMNPGELNDKAAESSHIYNIASRCGVFAKTDIQSLLNQGVPVQDICSSILAAVANQTISGLAQGRDIKGKVIYLGGPLTFMPSLRKAFDRALSAEGMCPENSLYYAALGAAMSSEDAAADISKISDLLRSDKKPASYESCPPLFESAEEYSEFLERHSRVSRVTAISKNVPDRAFIGIDAGSTTVKFAAVDGNDRIFFKRYLPSKGNPVMTVRTCLSEFYEEFPGTEIISAVSTGYGEEIIKNAFSLDLGIVETVAHLYGAKHFDPDADFIIDIGGQDIKCMKIRGSTIENIFLNEACSSGCGSFLQTFADNLGFSAEDFSKLAVSAKAPVDLGSRCTVFMNSSVKQAQKCGASVEDIAAGLAVSVVKNALYKVIRNTSELGEHIVVQGGTFLNDGVLRSFEKETGKNVTRPPESALMGAYGAALYGKQHCSSGSSILTAEEIQTMKHTVRNTVCSGCTNRCSLTLNDFGGDRTFVSGNKCERYNNPGVKTPEMNMYKYKRCLLASYKNTADEGKQTMGIPMGLNNYELYPFWYTFFSHLGFNVTTTPETTRQCYIKGQNTIPSDTVCYPAKLMHGHIKELIDMKTDYIFYPNMTYNVRETKGSKNYNCPVVEYYPEVIRGNTDFSGETVFISDFIGIHNRRRFPAKAEKLLKKYGIIRTGARVRAAAAAAYKELQSYSSKISAVSEKWLNLAKEKGIPVIILAGRPYHIDPEINHGIDTLISASGFAVISEDALPRSSLKNKLKVLNQWAYHSRLYNAAEYTVSRKDMDINLIQLVSFGCGLDAITGDEVKRILESGGKIYTQLKIDEIANLGAAKIRLKSLYAAVSQRRRNDDEK